MNVLIGKNLSFAYAGQEVVSGVDISIRSGEATVLVGPSGTGKTTLLWMLARLLKPSDGTVKIESFDTDAGSAAKKQRAAKFAMVFQQSALWEHLTVEKHLDIVLHRGRISRHEREEKISVILDRMQLADLRLRKPAELSGGQRRRLSLARALVVSPEWLILDEPLAHLDGQNRKDLFDLLRAELQHAGCGVIMATHNAAEGMSLADECAVMLDGRIIQRGSPREVYDNPINLPAALALGPANQICGMVKNGKLYRGETQIIDGLPASMSGMQELLLRPSNVKFSPDKSADAKVTLCRFAPPNYILHITIADIKIQASATEPIPTGTTGRVSQLL